MAKRKEMDSVVLLENCPSNSNKSKERKHTEVVEERREIKKVVHGKARKKKRSLGTKVTEALSVDDGESVGQMVLYDVLIPSLKDTIFEMVRSGFEMFLFGDSSRDDRVRRDRGRSYVSYSGYYDDRKKDRYKPRVKSNRNMRHDFDDVILDDRREANDVLAGIADIIDEYGEATVADFYSLAGISSDYTDRKWGWDNISNAYVERTREGWVVRLPRTIALD